MNTQGAARTTPSTWTTLTQFNTDRNFAFNEYLSDFDILQSQLAALQGQDGERLRPLDGQGDAGPGGEIEQRQQLGPGAGGTPSCPPAGPPARTWWSQGRVQQRVCAGPWRDAYRQQAAARVSSGQREADLPAEEGTYSDVGGNEAANDAVTALQQRRFQRRRDRRPTGNGIHSGADRGRRIQRGLLQQEHEPGTTTGRSDSPISALLSQAA